MTNKGLLKWQSDMGADEALADEPRNYFAAPKKEAPAETIPQTNPANAAIKLQASPLMAASNARQMADKSSTLAELEAAVRAFDGCVLKRTAAKTVFADGNPQGGIMVIGEAPGADEDRQGIPFCGVSGQLLDKMFTAIGMNRSEHIYISNTVFWRPPGNRQPSLEEMAICLPFVEKHIALVKPKLLVLAGGAATLSVLKRAESMSRLRGRIYDYENGYLQNAVKTVVTYHPSYLLRQPAQKKLAWQDMLSVQLLMNNS
jgi:uracil-DNA glycosylase family 4